MQNNNLVTEIFAGILAALLVIGGVFLLYFGKVDTTFALILFGSALGVFGFKVIASAPSPAQQSQLMSLVAQKQAQPPVVIHNYPAPVQEPVSAPAPMAEPASQPQFKAPIPIDRHFPGDSQVLPVVPLQ